MPRCDSLDENSQVIHVTSMGAGFRQKARKVIWPWVMAAMMPYDWVVIHIHKSHLFWSSRTVLRFWPMAIWLIYDSGKIWSRPQPPKPIDDGESKGNHPLLWPNYSGEWNITIYPDDMNSKDWGGDKTSPLDGLLGCWDALLVGSWRWSMTQKLASTGPRKAGNSGLMMSDPEVNKHSWWKMDQIYIYIYICMWMI